MSETQLIIEPALETTVSQSVDTKLEIMVIPVVDVDRS